LINQIFKKLLFLTFRLLFVGYLFSGNNYVYSQQNSQQDSIEIFDLIQASNQARIGKIDYLQAIKIAEEAIKLSESKQHKGGFYRANLALAYAKRDKGEKKAAIDIMLKAIDFFKNNQELESNKSYCETLVYTHTAMSDLYTYFPDYQNARIFADEALKLSKKYQIGQAQCLITMSILLSKQKNYDDANKYAEQAYELFLTKNANDDLGRVSAFMARYAVEKGDFTKAIHYYEKSKNHYETAKSNYGIRIALYNLADISLKTKNFEKADEYISKTFDITQSDDIVSSYYINIMKANVLYEKNDIIKSEKFALNALNYAKKDGTLANLKSSYELLNKIYFQQNNFQKAYEYLNLIQIAQDSLFNIELAKQTKELVSKYELESKQQRIEYLNIENKLKEENLIKEKVFSDLNFSRARIAELKSIELTQKNSIIEKENELKSITIKQNDSIRKFLEKQNQLSNSKIAAEENLINLLRKEQKLLSENHRKQKINIILLFALALFLLMFFLLMIYSYFKQKKNTRKIASQKERLQYLMNELHHRVKNNLQFMISMIRMQERTIQDKEAKEVLSDAEKRLQAVSLLHEKFYLHHQIDKIDFKEYLNDLLSMLTGQHNYKIDLKLEETPILMLGMETILPLGMIINELYSNVLKHQSAIGQNVLLKIGYSVNKGKVKLYFDSGVPNPSHFKEFKKGFGLKLIELFVQEIKGTLSYDLQNSYCYNICFQHQS